MLFIKCVLIFLILKMKEKVIGKLESDEVDTGFQTPKRRQQNYFQTKKMKLFFDKK